jgi:hypothetical protein
MKMTDRLVMIAGTSMASLWMRLGLFGLLAIAALWVALEHAGAMNAFRDSQFLLAYDRHAASIMARFWQLPWWDPYSYGGIYALGSPQAHHFSPSVLLALIFGPIRVHVVFVFLMSVLGMEGVFRYIRLRSEHDLGAAVAAPIFSLSGFFAGAYFLGWTQFFAVQALPWCLFGLNLVTRRDARGVVIFAVSITLMLAMGSPYTIVMTALACALECLRIAAEHATRSRELTGMLLPLLITALLTLGLAAYRLWPAIETLAVAPRIMAGAPANSLSRIAKILLSPHVVTAGKLSMEGSTFISIGAVVLAAVGVFRVRSIAPFLLTLFLVWMATGYEFAIAPFVWVRQLPFFDTLRYPERYLVFAALFIAELAASGVDRLASLSMRGPRWQPLLLVLILGIAATWVPLALNYQVATRGMSLWSPPERIEREFAQARGNRWALGYYEAMSRGSISCGEAYMVPMSPDLRGDLPAEEFLLDASAGTVTRRKWTPNRIELDVALNKDATLVVNQNWHPGWRSSTGLVRLENGRIAVDLPVGTHQLSLYFLPRSGVGGIAISIASIGVLAFLLLRRRQDPDLIAGLRRTPWISLAILAAPLLTGLLVGCLISEPPMPPATPRNSNGSELILDKLPENVTPLSAHFEVPVEWIGVTLPESAKVGSVVDFEIYMRRTGPVNRNVGIFVHILGPNKLLMADHEVIGNSLFIKDIPPGSVARDAFSISLTNAPPGKYRVLAGLWRASGDGSRVHLKSADDNRAQPDHRLLLGTFTVMDRDPESEP